MKKFISLISILIIGSQCIADTKISVASAEYRPIIYTENGEIKGICYDMITEMAKRAGVMVNIKMYPWARAMAMVKDGEIDAIFPAANTPERESFGVFMKKPLYLSQYGLFVKKGKEFEFHDINDLAGKRVGIMKGTIFTEEFEKAKKNNIFTVEEVVDEEMNLKKVNADRLDVFVVNRLVGLDEVKRFGLQNAIVLLPKPLNKGTPQFLFLSQKSTLENKEKVVQDFDRILTEMTNDNTIKKIYNTYLK